MTQIFKMALRDLGRNRRRSFFSALALAVGLALLMLMASVVEGQYRDAMNTTIRLVSGHLQVRAANYNESKTSLKWEDLLENPETITAQINTLDPVVVATPRLMASGIAASGDESLGVSVMGIDPASSANDPFKEGMIEGQFLQADDREGILIGRPLAEKLNLSTGDNLNLLINTSDGAVDEQPFVVRGVYSTKTPAYDERTIFMPLSKAQAITRTEGHASMIFVMLKDRDQADGVAQALQGSKYQVKTWQQLNSLILETETMANSYIYILYLIVLAITATVIVNTLIMAVFERTREIGILSSIGMRSSQIMAMFFAESSLLAVGGIVMGLALGGLGVYFATTQGFYIGNMGVTGMMIGERIYGYPNPEDFITLTILTFVITLLAALYPALLAANMEPVSALRGGK